MSRIAFDYSPIVVPFLGQIDGKLNAIERASRLLYAGSFPFITSDMVPPDSVVQWLDKHFPKPRVDPVSASD